MEMVESEAKKGMFNNDSTRAQGPMNSAADNKSSAKGILVKEMRQAFFGQARPR
jgi:hypothetical protein